MTNGTHNQDHRPSPEAFLAAAEQDQRGRLKIFLGAAPGVGKTCTMLEAAQVRKREGVDVVVAVRLLIAAVSGETSKITESKMMLWWVLIGTAVVVGSSALAKAIISFLENLAS